MAFESYGAGDVWSSGPGVDSSANLIAAGKLALAAGIAGGAFMAATNTRANGTRPIDTFASFARTAGNLSPFQLGNTFRIPEFMFPFTSPSYQGLQGGEYVFGKDYLTSSETTNYLKRITGKTSQELHTMGLSQESLIGGTGADSLVFRAGDRGRGSLFARKGTQEALLSDSVMLMSMDTEVDPLARQVRNTNRATKGVLQALDMYTQGDFKEGNLFAKKVVNSAGEVTTTRAPVLPVPSITGPTKSMGDVLRRTSYFRGVSAFEISRFNDLLGGYSKQLFGETGERFMSHVLGIAPKVTPGPASAMLMRYAGRVSLLGAAALGVSETDWLRREYGLPGHAIGAAATTGLGAYAAWKLGASNRLLMMGSVGAFFGQMVMPGFDQGLTQGIASTAAGLDITRGSALNPFGYYRRTLEGFAPGISSWETGALFGIAAVMASAAKIPGTGKRVSEHLVERFGASRLGLSGGALGVAPDELLSTRDVFWQQMENTSNPFVRGSERWRTFRGRREIYSESLNRLGSRDAVSRHMNQVWRQAEDSHRSIMRESSSSPGGVNKALLSRLEGIASKYEGGNALQRNVLMQVEGFGAQAYYSFFGANATYDKTMMQEIQKLGFSGATPVGKFGRVLSIGLAAFGAHQLLTGGLLGSMESSDELKDIYSGKKLVEVKKSRWWEGGGTPFSGGETSYFRPHQLSLFMNRTRERGIWGEDEDRISPLGKFIRKNFTYELEERNYYTRPYPISSGAFEDVPIIGGLLASTVGRLIKSPKLMHVSEWARPDGQGGYEYNSVFKGSRAEPAYALGAQGPGTPVSPFASAERAKFISYQFRELEGMTGWAKGIMQSMITGKADWATSQPVLTDASLMSSSRIRFWEMNLGGGMFSSELWRRIFPRYQSDVQKTNPIRNSMPAWMPDKFHYGDPYRSVEWGEARLPGAGFASLHPELRGVAPEDYPLIARYSILADIAPTSIEFRRTQELMYKKRSEGVLTPEQEQMIDETDSRVARQVNQRSFERVDDRAISLPGSGLTQSMWFGGQSLIRHVAAPAEYLIPMGFRPFQKLMGETKDPIEQYESERLYGTPMAFWDKPYRDWFRPAAYSAAHMIGFDGKPAWRQEADNVDQQFDQIEFSKWMRLAVQAEDAGDTRAKNQYLWAASNTRMGINPQGNALSIYWTLPESDRSFFNAFALAKDSDRARILEMIPKDQAGLYKTIWGRLDSGDQTLFTGGASGVDENYLKTRYYEQPTQQLPPEDWIGWNSEVDLSDIKVKYADKYASDIADYGMWQSQLKKADSQEFLEGAEDYIGSPTTIAAGNIRSSLYNISGNIGSRSNFSVFNTTSSSRVRMTYNDRRDSESQSILQKVMYGY